MELLIKRVVIITIIALTIGQSFFFSVAAAVQPWSGNTWTGETWTGDTWEGTPWEGKTWTGDSWEGESWEGDGTSGDGTAGDGTSGDGTSGDGTSGDGTSGDGTSGDGTSGDGTSGDGTSGDGTSGDGTSGDGTSGGGTSGDGTSGDGTSGDGTSGDGTAGDGTSGDGTSGDGTSVDGTSGDGTSGDGTSGDGTSGDGTSGDGTTGDGTSSDGTSGESTNAEGPDGYKVFNYIAKDVILGQVDLAGNSLTSTNGEMGRQTGSFLVGLALNGLKLGVDSPVLEYAADANDAVANGFSAYDAVNTLRNAGSLTQASQTGGTMMAGAVQSAAPAMGALGKLNLVAAVGGTVLGGIDTYNKTFGDGGVTDTFNDSNASGADKTVAVSDATASLGSTMMSAGIVTAAFPFPGAQAIGAGIVVAGAALWGVSKLTGYVAKNWDGIKSTASKAGNFIAKGWNSFTGLFG